MRRFIAVALVVASAAAVPAAATATAPVFDRGTVQRAFDDFYVCDGFNVIGEFSIQRTRMSFFDRDGNEIRSVIHRDFVGTFTNSVTGASLPLKGHDTITFYPDGSVVITGNALHVVVPGEGTVLLIAGRFAFDAEGNPTLHGRDDDPLVCGALS
jgi:hypothetical protein